MNKRLLIVSYVFPPQPGVGGRRWAKFAKYLSRKGYDVNVLCCQNVTNTTSEWMQDIKGINVKYLPLKFPKVILYPTNSFIDKLKYRFYLNILRLVDKGNYYDRTIFWKKQIQKEISEAIVNKKIDCVIVTSGPFRLSYYVTQLKNNFPEVKFIADFRDLWTEDTEITSFSSISNKRRRHEKKWEKQTVFLADHVITTIDRITDYFASLNIANKFVTIPNGFDKEDFESVSELPKPDPDKISIVYAGTLYLNLQYILKPFFKALGEIKKNNLELYNKIKIEFIGNFPKEYEPFLKEYDIRDAVKLFPKLPLKEVFGKINNSNYCMLILNDVYNFSLSTKFYEYISRKKKILVVSNKGDSAEFIEKHKLGKWINPKNAYEDLLKTLQPADGKNDDLWESDLDINDFSIEKLTNKLEGLINSPYAKTKPSNVKHLLLTFDYELFLGDRSGSVSNCMLKPTRAILDILNRNGITKAIFFVDTTYLLKLMEGESNENSDDFRSIIFQLVELVKAGHYVFPHLHPHWKDAQYDEKNNQWKLENLESYRFHNLNEKEKEMLFEGSMQIIKELQNEAGIYYDIDSYRAGGWCLQPFEDFFPYFKKHHIKHDFSVLKGFSKLNNLIYYNYTNTPLKKIYRFSKEVEKEKINGEFYEFSISSLEAETGLERFKNKIFDKYLWFTNKNFGDGVSVSVSSKGDILTDGIVDLVKDKKGEMASIELLTLSPKLAQYKKHLKENDYLHIISHPKMVSKHNLKMFDRFLKSIKQQFEINTDYKKMIEK